MQKKGKNLFPDDMVSILLKNGSSSGIAGQFIFSRGNSFLIFLKLLKIR